MNTTKIENLAKATPSLIAAGRKVKLEVSLPNSYREKYQIDDFEIQWSVDKGELKDENEPTSNWETDNLEKGTYRASVVLTEKKPIDPTKPLNLAGEVTISVVDLTLTCEADPKLATLGQVILLKAIPSIPDEYTFEWFYRKINTLNWRKIEKTSEAGWDWNTKDLEPGNYEVKVELTQIHYPEKSVTCTTEVRIVEGAQQMIGTLKDNLDKKIDTFTKGLDGVAEKLPGGGRAVSVALKRTKRELTEDVGLWVVIQGSAENLSYNNYNSFLDIVLCQPEHMRPAGFSAALNDLKQKRYLPYTDVDAYRLLKVATEAFLMVNCGVNLPGFRFTPGVDGELGERMQQDVDFGTVQSLWNNYLEAINGRQNPTLPYLALIRKKLPELQLKNKIFDSGLPEDCYGILKEKLTNPCFLELIWSFYHELGFLVSSIDAISLRFQNKRGVGERDPLAHLELDPLRPLNNLLWGYIQDEQHRLTIKRRAYEYEHHYGTNLYGKEAAGIRPADKRSNFLRAYHDLLHLCTIFFQQDDDTTVVADGFPLLNALKEVHLILSEGAHNQYGDLPWTARQEMLIQQWLLARPEMREFLPQRLMTAFPEPWQPAVESLRKLMGWPDISVIHFRNLGVFGEQLLLSIRFGNWSDESDASRAANWARYWRQEIQGYIHAYRAVTMVDLTSEPVDSTPPATLIRDRMQMVPRHR